MKKIVFISLNGGGVFLNENIPIGGAETQLFNITKYLSEDRDYNIFVITSVLDDIKKRKTGKINIYGIIKLHNNKFIKWLVSIFNIIVFLVESRPNYIVFRGSPNFAGIICLLSFVMGIKFVYSFALDKIGDRVKNISLKLLKLSYKVVVQNGYQREYAKKLGYKRIFVIPNMIPPSNLCRGDSILWIGRFTYQKSPELLYDIIKRAKEHKFIVVVSSVDEKYEKLKSEICKMPNVRCYERVPYQDMDKIWEKGRILLLTSHFEGTPNVVLEAWSHGIPVVSCKVDVDGFLSKGVGGYLCRDNLVDCIKESFEMNMDNKTIDMLIGKRNPYYVIEMWKNVLE